MAYFQQDNDPIMELYHHITRDDDKQSVALLSGFRGKVPNSGDKEKAKEKAFD